MKSSNMLMTFSKAIAKGMMPTFISNKIRNRKSLWTGRYSSWQAALDKASGYDSQLILERAISSTSKVIKGEALWERDTKLFNHIEYVPGFLAALAASGAFSKKEFKIIDFGGAFGSLYYQHREVLRKIPDLSWTIVEQAYFVKVGQECFSNDIIKFVSSLKEAPPANLLIVSSVLQYLEDPYKYLSAFKEKGEWVLIDRTGFTNETSDRLTIQSVPEEIYKASYPCWFLSEEKFKNEIKGKFEIVCEFYSKERVSDESLFFKGFILRSIK